MGSKYDAEFSPDIARGAVVKYMDFRPSTLLEESLNDGHTRPNKPVGAPTTAPAENQTTGGARMGDALDAARIGAIGRKNQTK